MPVRAFASKDYWKVYGPAALVAGLVLVLAYRWVGPPPPDHIRMAGGAEGGAYHRYALQYAAILARHGITVEVVTTAGSTENLALLKAAELPVDVALVQSGLAGGTPDGQLMGLASLYPEPFWVLYRADISPAPTQLNALKGRRICVGPDGSGTQALSRQLLAANGVTDANSQLRPMGLDAAAAALRAGDLDVICVVSSASNATLHGLVADPAVSLLNVERADAYIRRYRFLHRVTLPAGLMDLETNVPARSHSLIGPTATLVARRDFHPALVDLMLQAASEIHSGGDAFAEPGQFPSSRYLDFPLSPDADRYFKHGPPFLQRYLPFWLATFVDRMKVMLVPLIVLLLPLFKVIPPTFRWRTRSKIIRWYKRLQILDLEMESDDRQMTNDALLQEIDQIEHEVCGISVPLGYADQLYNLRLHVALMRDKVGRKTRDAARIGAASDAD